MRLKHAIGSAVLVAAAATAAAAQDRAVAATPQLDVAKLPVDISRIRRQLVRVTVREERGGLGLRYMVDVFAQAPPIDLFPAARVDPNFWTSPAPYGAPTHRDFLMLNTPIEHRGAVANIGGLFGLGSSKSKSDKNKK